MTDRISSYPTTTGLMQQTMRLQSKYASVQQQQSSSLKSEHFSGIAGDSQRLLNLQSQFSMVTRYSAAISSAQSRITSMQGALDSTQNLFTSVLSNLSLAQSGGNSTVITAEQASAWRDELVNVLNSKYSGSYVFSGNATDTAPVNLSAPGYDPTTLTTTPDFGYYQGDNQTASVQADSNLNISCGINANNPAFEKAIRALSTIINNPGDQATLTQAYDWISQAADSVADISGVLASKANLLTNNANTHAATLDYLDTNMSDLRNADVAAVTLQLSQIETQLEASYSTLSKLLNLKLTDYLR